MSNMKAEQQYIDLFAQCEDLVCRHSTPVMNALRADALANFERLGFPSTRSEDYKYTDVAQAFAPDYGLNINRVAIPVNPYDVFRCDVPNLSTSLYFVVNDTFYDKDLPKAHLPEGVYAGGLKAFTEQYPEIASKYYGKAAPSSKDGIIALNTMLAQDGFVVYVPKNLAQKQNRIYRFPTESHISGFVFIFFLLLIGAFSNHLSMLHKDLSPGYISIQRQILIKQQQIRIGPLCHSSLDSQ